ncbi:MAG TPA: hypothetical protein VLI44_00350, partial [Sporolactobacillaceae bacterium]|nr:hypothetical protein [Sporolactobacillaceae bacterium]
GENTQLINPTAIALDSTGDIYVANEGTQDDPGSITIFRAGSNGDVAPVARIAGPKTRLKSAEGVAVDSHGYIYVTNENRAAKESDSITVYSPGSTGDSPPPVRVISGPATELASPEGIAVERKLFLRFPEKKENNRVAAPGDLNCAGAANGGLVSGINIWIES